MNKSSLSKQTKASIYRKAGEIKVYDMFGPQSIYHLDTWRRDVTAYYWPKLNGNPELLAQTVNEVCLRNKRIEIDKKKHLEACRRAAYWKPGTEPVPFIKDENVIQMYIFANKKRAREAKQRILRAKAELEMERPGIYISLIDIANRAGSSKSTVHKILKDLTIGTNGNIRPLSKSSSSCSTNSTFLDKDSNNRLIDPFVPEVKRQPYSVLNTGTGMSHISNIMQNLVKRLDYADTG